MATVKKYKDETLLRLGKTISRIRKEKEISQERLAYEANIHRTSINRLEIGEMEAGVLLLTKLCRALQMSVAELFYRAKI